MSENIDNNIDSMEVWDFLSVFMARLDEQLKSDKFRWGNTWKKRYKEGQEARIHEHIQTYFDQFEEVGTPVPWLKIAGLAMIGWIRETYKIGQ